MSRPTAAKPYLKTLTHSIPFNGGNNNHNGGNSSFAADFEQIKAMLKNAISKKCSVFISYSVKKKPTVQKREGEKKKYKKKGEQPILEDTYKQITPKCFAEKAHGQGLKVIIDCNLRDGTERAFFFHKIIKIEDHN
jgi:hypothetical protein